MRHIIVGGVLFLGGISGTLALLFITSNKINSQMLIPLTTGNAPDNLVTNVVDYNILHSLIEMGLKAPLFIFLATMFMGFYLLLSGLEKKVHKTVEQNCNSHA